MAIAAAKWAIKLVPSSLGHIGKGQIGNAPVVLVLPLSWMNLSGEVVKPLVTDFGVSPDHLIVVHDDLDLPVGRMRVKFGGGTGGHNGLLSIIMAMEADGFYRLKLGVGRPAPNQETADYVLAPFEDSELLTINAMLDRSVEALQCLVIDGPADAMNRFNQRVKE